MRSRRNDHQVHSHYGSMRSSHSRHRAAAQQAPAPGLGGISVSSDPLTVLWQTSMLTQQSVQQLVQAQLHLLQMSEAQRGFGQLWPKKEVREQKPVRSTLQTGWVMLCSGTDLASSMIASSMTVYVLNTSHMAICFTTTWLKAETNLRS